MNGFGKINEKLQKLVIILLEFKKIDLLLGKIIDFRKLTIQKCDFMYIFLLLEILYEVSFK